MTWLNQNLIKRKVVPLFLVYVDVFQCVATCFLANSSEWSVDVTRTFNTTSLFNRNPEIRVSRFQFRVFNGQNSIKTRRVLILLHSRFPSPVLFVFQGLYVLFKTFDCLVSNFNQLSAAIQTRLFKWCYLPLWFTFCRQKCNNIHKHHHFRTGVLLYSLLKGPTAVLFRAPGRLNVRSLSLFLLASRVLSVFVLCSRDCALSVSLISFKWTLIFYFFNPSIVCGMLIDWLMFLKVMFPACCTAAVRTTECSRLCS